jgi:hypothetical protein
LGLLAQLGAEGVVMDGLDAMSVGEAVAAARPDAIVHQMTAISVTHAGKPDMKRFDRWFAPTYPAAHRGDGPLAGRGRGDRRIPFYRAELRQLERYPQGRMGKDRGGSAGFDGGTAAQAGMGAIHHVEDVVLRAGGAVCDTADSTGRAPPTTRSSSCASGRFPLVGGGTGYTSWVHLDDAASATVLAVEQQARGVFNIVDDEPAPADEWLPYLAACAGAKPPMRVPKWLARPLAGEVVVTMMTEGRGFSNAKARRELGWELRYPSWRQGFKDGLA